MTRATYEQIVKARHGSEGLGATENTEENTADVADMDCEATSSDALDISDEKPPLAKKGGVPRGTVPALLKAIRDEAEKYSLLEKYFVKSDRTIRNWLNDKGTPDGFSDEVLMSQEARDDFARKYVEGEWPKAHRNLPPTLKKKFP